MQWKERLEVKVTWHKQGRKRRRQKNKNRTELTQSLIQRTKAMKTSKV